MLLLTGPEHRDTYDNGLVLMGGKNRVTVHEEGSSETRQGTAWCVWDGSIVLVRHFEAAFVQGTASCPDRILELGAGCGVAGLGLAILFENAKVCLTDIPDALDSLSRNVQLNPTVTSRVSVSACDWTCPPLDLLQKPFDLVIAADCVWLEELVEPFVETMTLISKYNPTCVFFLSYQSRTRRVDRLLFDSLRRNRFVVEEVDMAKHEPPRGKIQLYRLHTYG
ncbi:hypothetical protein M9434_007112 [Picochlorum sp. BPE23]|nr:hypothetical protein M9434_007112 [Picochlorum sp. BPE23]